MKKQQTEIDHAHIVMRRGLTALVITWALGLATMIYVGETTLWASPATKLASGYTQDAEPSIEIRAGDRWATGGISRK